MWTAQRQRVAGGLLKLFPKEREEAVSYGRVIELWRDDDAFRRFFLGLLQDCPFDCFRFETPPVAADTVDRPFEFVLADSPEIDLAPDPGDFNAHFESYPDDILVFDNLGGDATLVVPRPPASGPGYAHIAGFVRYAPPALQLDLWRTVGRALAEALHRPASRAPLWLNTAGGGVAWLHVRLDSRPKYYVFYEYCAAFKLHDR